MHVFVDDSGCGGFKFGSGSTSHLIMAACVFRDPKQIEELAQVAATCRARCSHPYEFKYSNTRKKVRQRFFEDTADIDYAIRAISIDKVKIYSTHLRSSPSALKSFAIRQLLTKNFGFITDAKVVIDGQDTKAFGVSDTEYLMRMVNRERPGSLRAVSFADSKQNVGIQLADMVAGAINHSVRTHKPRDITCFEMIWPRMWQPRGSLWHFR